MNFIKYFILAVSAFSTLIFAQAQPPAHGKKLHLECEAGEFSPVFTLDRFSDGTAQFSGMLNISRQQLPIFHGIVYEDHLEALAKRAEIYRKLGRGINIKLDECSVEFDGNYIHCYSRSLEKVGELKVDRFSFYYQKSLVLTLGERLVQYRAGIEFISGGYRYDLPFDYNDKDCRNLEISY